MAARHLSVGDELTLPSPAGPRRERIVGAYRDFNTGNYAIVMALARVSPRVERYGAHRAWRRFA